MVRSITGRTELKNEPNRSKMRKIVFAQDPRSKILLSQDLTGFLRGFAKILPDPLS